MIYILLYFIIGVFVASINYTVQHNIYLRKTYGIHGEMNVPFSKWVSWVVLWPACVVGWFY